ncbi:MAG TPA: alpha/beta fold hydrolase, partial [Thermoanaerobaculia bacterium]|nr:alpha/beta fold hydrolase [Thermoanaerobaculia bacterium]
MPRSILAAGLRFAYLESGRGEGNRPLVLLLHGFPDDAYTFDELRPALAAAGYHAVAVFLRGYHPSDVPADGDSSPLTLGRDVLALIAAFGAADAVVIGHDWGAIAGYVAASLAPERVRRLVAMGIPHARALRPTPRQVWRARHFVYLTMPWAARAMRRTDLAYVDRFNRRMSPRWAPLAEDVERVKTAFALPGRLEAALDYYRDVA